MNKMRKLCICILYTNNTRKNDTNRITILVTDFFDIFINTMTFYNSHAHNRNFKEITVIQVMKIEIRYAKIYVLYQ